MQTHTVEAKIGKVLISRLTDKEWQIVDINFANKTVTLVCLNEEASVVQDMVDGKLRRYYWKEEGEDD